MRFKAIVNNPLGLHKLALSLEKLGPICIASFSTDKLSFITYLDDRAGAQSWTEMLPTSMFTDYRIESQHQNEINFSFGLADMLNISKDLIECTRIQVALKRRGTQSILLFQWQEENFVGSKAVLSKELPIEIIRRDRLTMIREPMTIRAPETYILLPAVVSLQPAAEQLRGLSTYITILANMNGEFRVEADSPYAVCSLQYENLTNPQLDGHYSERDPFEFSQVRIKSEDFGNFLGCIHLEPDDIICNIASETQIAFLVYVNFDSYQNEDAPIRSLHANQCKMTYHLPVYLE